MKRVSVSPVALATALLLGGIVLWGWASIAILPPFEGFDEPGHYSYIEQLAWAGTRPHHGDPMSAEVDAYLADAPTAEAMQGAWTYGAFFSAAPEAVAEGRAAAKGAAVRADAWTPGRIANWEAQHPPLYYALLAPLARATAGLSLAGRLLVLRGASYTLACAGLLLGCLAARRLARRMDGPSALAVRLAPVLWPLLLPMWFADVARLGNDSLVALVAGAVAWLVCHAPEPSDRPRSGVLLGALLGVGLLTKATVLPLAVATVLLLAWRVLRTADRGRRRAGAVHLGLCCLAVAAVSGWWYVGQALETGSLIGSNDSVNVGAQGGLASLLREHGSVAAFLRIPYTYTVSMVWAGTWSAVVPPLALVLPAFVVALLVVAAAAARSRRRGWTFAERLALVTLVLFLAGLTFQSVYLIAVNGNPAPAWYLQSFLPILAVLLAPGIAEGSRHRVPWAGRLAVLACLPAFLVLVTVTEAITFAGCGATSPNSHRLTWSSLTACAGHPDVLTARLNEIAFPGLGIALAVPGLLLIVGGLGVVASCWRTSRRLAPLGPTADS